jgi:hypothetical protein
MKAASKYFWTVLARLMAQILGTPPHRALPGGRSRLNLAATHGHTALFGMLAWV